MGGEILKRWLRWFGIGTLALLLDAYLMGAALSASVSGPEAQGAWLRHPLISLLRLASFQGTAAQTWWLVHIGAALAAGYLISQRRATRRAPSPAPASQYGSHGSARWATDRELRERLAREGQGLILGKSNGRYLVLPDRDDLPLNQLVVVFGGSGARKTRSFVMPNLLNEENASIVVVDPKAENFAKASDVLRRRGYRVQVLNFLDMAHSDRWNPLDYVQSPTDAADLACNLVANTTNPNRIKGDPFWDMAEQSLITALVLYVKHHCRKPEQHLGSVLELGTEPDGTDLDAIFLRLPKADPARKFYRTFLRAEEKVRAGVIAGLGSRLQLWNDEQVAALTAASDIELETLGTERTALFLLVPDFKATYAPVLALLWQQIFQVLYTVADQHGGRLPVRVRCRMDEAANCGYIPDLEKKLSTMRSRRISAELIFQTLGQLKSRYPNVWSEILGNCDTWLYLGGNDLETAQYISGKLGNTTIIVHGRGSSDSYTSSSTSESESYAARPLKSVEELLRLPAETALLLQKGHDPAQIAKADYSEHPAAAGISLLDHNQYRGNPREALATLDVDEHLGKALNPRETPVDTAPPATPEADDATGCLVPNEN